METTDYLTEIIKELQRSVPLIADAEANNLVNGILEAKKVFITGAGRSGFMGKSFAMRLMHMGIDAYTIGETITPNYETEDLLVIGSGSGETKSLRSIAEKAQQIGGKIAVVTINPDSSLGQLAHLTIKLPGSPKDQSEAHYQTIQPMGSLFEQILLLFYDAIILSVMEKKGQNTTKMYGKHANLE